MSTTISNQVKRIAGINVYFFGDDPGMTIFILLSGGTNSLRNKFARSIKDYIKKIRRYFTVGIYNFEYYKNFCKDDNSLSFINLFLQDLIDNYFLPLDIVIITDWESQDEFEYLKECGVVPMRVYLEDGGDDPKKLDKDCYDLTCFVDSSEDFLSSAKNLIDSLLS